VQFAGVGTATLAALTFEIASGITYSINYSLPWRTGSTTAGLRVGLLFPAAITAAFNVDMTNSSDGTTYYHSGLINASGDSVVNPSAPTQNLDLACVIEGTLLCSGSGKIMVYGAGEVATASASAPRFRQGGNGICWAIG
jgi:uncharacterized membrane protein